MNAARELMTDVSPFQLFGFGARRKLVYQAGALRDAMNGEVVFSWGVRAEVFERAGYRVMLETGEGPVVIEEDEEGVWIRERGDRRAVTRGMVRLPDFAGHPHAELLRVLHGEILLNVMPWGPVPNLWVYTRPWYRDSAMMAMVLQKTGNLHVLEGWIEGLHQPYDYNNSGVAEPDNLGQVLFLASLGSGRSHRVVERVLAAAKKCSRDGHLVGRSDFKERPVYQTKWMKWGLRSLGMDDSEWRIPVVADDYSALFWMDFREEHVAMERTSAEYLAKYPYLHWAEAHFHGLPAPEILGAEDFPLTREVQASEASYGRMKMVSAELAEERYGTPHTWHGAEVFLYYVDGRVSPQGAVGEGRGKF